MIKRLVTLAAISMVLSVPAYAQQPSGKGAKQDGVDYLDTAPFAQIARTYASVAALKKLRVVHYSTRLRRLWGRSPVVLAQRVRASCERVQYGSA
jgi:hypothetical protein